jgi:hypothetical protein
MAVKVKAGGGGHHRALEKRASATPARTPDNTGSSQLPADYSLHAVTNDYDDLTDEELAALRESLRTVGQLVKVVIWKGQIVDGRHRAKLCKELGLDLKCYDIGDVPEDEMRRVVRALNEHRRSKMGRLPRVSLSLNPSYTSRPFGAHPSADSDLMGAIRLLKQAHGLFDALGRGRKRRRDIGFHRLRAIHRGSARVLQGGQLGFDPVHALALLRKLVDEDERRHDGEPHIPDFPERAAQIRDTLIEIVGQSRQMMFLAVIASHAILATVDADAHVGHG